MSSNDSRYHLLRSGHELAYRARVAEIEQGRAGTQAGKEAIYEKYRTPLDAIWKPEPGPKQSEPARPEWARFNLRFAGRQNEFNIREETRFGRFQNASGLVKRGAGLFAVVRLALNAPERRRLFERDQRRFRATTAPKRQDRPQERPKPMTPEPKRVQAERLKAMRTAELAAYARQRTAAAISMEARHQFQRQAEQAERAAWPCQVYAAVPRKAEAPSHRVS